MSQNNITMIYAGLDLAKATLQLSLQGAGHALDNDATGHRQLLRLVRKAGAKSGAKIHVVLEATGGYEKAVVQALHAAGIALSVMRPSRVRAFAHAQGQLAKTDPIDADVLAAFGEAIRPAPGTIEDGEAAALAGLAPDNRDSGPHAGQRGIHGLARPPAPACPFLLLGGRATVRCALSMAALSAVRHDPILRRFYQGLRARGKLAKVALTAAMRKLLILLNRMLKNPEFKLRSAQA